MPAALTALGLPSGPEIVGRLSRLTEMLIHEAIPRGFLGPNEADRLLPRHIIESAALVPLIGEAERLVDVGSGAGLPGLVIACFVRTVVLVEAQAKRAAFLRDAAQRLGLGVSVVQARAEDAGRGPLRDSADSVIARALATLPVALELCLPFAAPGGRFVYLAGEPQPDVARETCADEAGGAGPHPPRDKPGSALDPGGLDGVAEQLGGGPAAWTQLAVPGAEGGRWVMIVEKILPTPERFPRRAGVPKGRPLG